MNQPASDPAKPNTLGNPGYHADSELLTAEELAGRLRIAPRTVACWYREGRLPGMKLGGKCLRFYWPDVLRALGGISSKAGRAGL